MISMTGFGRATRVAGQRSVVIEIRSVNHRGLDIKVRSRALDAAAEVEAIRAVRARCARGSVQVAIDAVDGADKADPGGRIGEADELGVTRLRALRDRLEVARVALGLPGVVDLITLAAFVRLDHETPSAPTPLTWPEVQPALEEALARLQETRSQEGAALAVDLRARAANLGQLVDGIQALIPASAERAGRRLTERLHLAAAGLGAGGPLDPGRLAQEVAILADRLDVSEELARLGAHMIRLGQLVAGNAAAEGIGRPLEFLLQELGRELNTLGTKAQDAEISSLVSAGKAELEKIREQAQNIE